MDRATAVAAAFLALALLVSCRAENDAPPAVSAYPDARSALTLAKTMERDGSYEEAAGLYRYYLGLAPGDWEARFALADVYLRSGLPGRARLLLESSAPPASLEGEYLRRLSAAAYREGDYEKALTLYRRMAAKDPHGRYALSGEAKCLRELGHYRESLEIFCELTNAGGDFWVYYDMGKLLDDLSDKSNAEAVFRKALAFRDGIGTEYSGLAEDRLARTLFDEAAGLRRAGRFEAARMKFAEITNDPALAGTDYAEKAEFWLERT